MAFTPITGQPIQYSTENNEIASGYYLKFYDVGTLNGYSVAVDSTGTPTLAKVKLNDDGYPISNPLDNDTVFIPHVDQDYRIILYKNETDADADTTANADFNVDSISQNVAPSADAKDITLRDVDIEIQDDYDRSPLFVDGGGFTAGAGPHVITPAVVTPAWVPNDADTRFYRLDNSGIVTVLTPTSSDATTFTLTETLLSTDTIFIGDDNFRNQMDGDPEDIRTRLSVSSTAEGDARYLLEANNLSDLDSASTARTNLDVYSETQVDDAIRDAVRNFNYAATGASGDVEVTYPASVTSSFVTVKMSINAGTPSGFTYGNVAVWARYKGTSEVQTQDVFGAAGAAALAQPTADDKIRIVWNGFSGGAFFVNLNFTQSLSTTSL